MPDVSGLMATPVLASDFSSVGLFLAIAPLLIAVCVVVSVAGIALVSIAAYQLRSTTLLAPLAWVILNLVLWPFAVAMPLRDAQGTPLPAERQTIVAIASLSMVCPIVAVLGARRPQNRIWPLVVISLLVILILPKAPNLLGQSDRQLAHSVWKWFFAGLLLVGWSNYLPTRLMLATTLWCLPGLSWVCSDAVHWSLIFAPGLAGAVGVLSAKRWSARSTGWNVVWRDFRTLYGAVWALRVEERTHALAESLDAGVALDWWGFYRTERHGGVAGKIATGGGAREEPAPEEMDPLEPGLRNLLRRYVSNPWIDARLSAASSETSE